MAKTKKNNTESDSQKEEITESQVTSKLNRVYSGILKQGFITLAFWMTFGLFLEGLLGYKIPAYLNNNVRRELFRLAHTHGALFSILLIIVAICLKFELIKPNEFSKRALRVGTVLMPLGFLFGGIWHYESDPGIAIFLVPIGAILIIFAIVDAVLSIEK